MLAASAGTLADLAKKMKAVDGVTFIDATKEARKEQPNIKTASIFTPASQEVADQMQALVDSIPAELLITEVDNQGIVVTMYGEKTKGDNGEFIIWITTPAQELAVYCTGKYDELLKEGININ